MSQEQRITVGDPIWVESLMTTEEWKARRKMYGSSTTAEPVQFDPTKHSGGTWRKGMGKGYTSAELIAINKQLDNLYNLLQTKKFQKRPEYGPHAEAKP